jgi:hypothetical protein
VQDDPRSGQTDANVDRVRTLVRSDRRIAVRLTAEEGYGYLLEGKDPNSSLTCGFYTTTMALRVMR